MMNLGRRPSAAHRARSDARPASSRGERRGIQIGPRIRVGGTVGKIGQDIKIGAGKVASSPITQAIAGAFGGPAAAAALAATGRALDTSHGSVGLGDIVKSSATGALAGAGGATVKGALAKGISLLSGGSTNPDGSAMSAIDKARALISGGGGDGKGNLGLAGDLAGKLFGGGGGGGEGDGSGGTSMLDKLLMGGSIASGIADKQRQEGFQTRAANYATDPFDAKAGIRDKALAALNGANDAPDLSSIFQNPGNGYDRQRRGMPSLTTRAPAAAQQMTGTALENRLNTRIPVSV